MKKAILAVVTLCFCAASFAASTITTRVEDPKAIYLDAPATAGDNFAALQAAIDPASGTGREGIVFVPAARYTMTRSVFLWPGVRLIGYGATRPVFVLPPNTPGFQKGMRVMVMFTGLTPHEHPRAGNRIAFPPPGSVPPNNEVADANPNTFYSAMSNIDFEIGDGNPAAVAVRFHVAQHSFLTHMDFHLSSALARGCSESGKRALHFRAEVERMRINLARCGLPTTRTQSPDPAIWQCTGSRGDSDTAGCASQQGIPRSSSSHTSERSRVTGSKGSVLTESVSSS